MLKKVLKTALAALFMSGFMSGLMTGLCFAASAEGLVAPDVVLPGPILAASHNNNVALRHNTPMRLGEGLNMRDKGEDKMAGPDKAFSRARQFIHRFYRPKNPSNELIVLLHGSGGDETSLVPLAMGIWPRAVLLGVRGRVLQEGETRWYRRITAVKFDQKDVKLEANAFVRFLTKLADKESLNLAHATFVGYSNGANLLAATMFLHPDMVKRAVMMRSMPVLDHAPAGNLAKARILTISGADDALYSPFAPALSAQLRSRGAQVDGRVVNAGHMLGEGDSNIIAQWLDEQGPDSSPKISMKTE